MSIMSEYWRAWRGKASTLPQRLKAALEWVGIEHGRAADYHKLLSEYAQGQRTNEHFFAYYEATEILAIFDSWHIPSANFLGIQEKISYIFKKGTTLRENENASANSNRPRNDAFVYILAGQLLRGSGIELLSVDGSINTSAPEAQHPPIQSADIVLSF